MVLEDHLRLLQRLEHLPVQQLIPQSAVEGLAVGVLPRAPRGDVQRLRPTTGQPAPHRLRHELGAVVAADELRLAPHLEEVLQGRYHILGSQVPLHLDRQAFSGELVHHRQDPQAPAVDGLVVDEVVAPDVARALGPAAGAAVLALAQATAFPLDLGHFQALTTPEPVDPLEVDRPPLSHQQGLDPTVAIAGVLPGQGPDPQQQLFLSFSFGPDVPLTRPGHAQGSAGPTLGDLERRHRTGDGLSPPGRAHEFPRAASLRIALSRLRSATRALSRAFSLSSSLSRFISSALMPPNWLRQR